MTTHPYLPKIYRIYETSHHGYRYNPMGVFGFTVPYNNFNHVLLLGQFWCHGVSNVANGIIHNYQALS